MAASRSKYNLSHSPPRMSRSRLGQRQQQLDEEGIAEVKEAFRLFDTANRGSIDIRELKAAFRALGFNVKKEEIRQLVTHIGKETADSILYEEFENMVTPKILARDPREEIRKIFALFDDDNSGGITFRKLKKVANELGEKLSDKELQEMIDEADRDRDGIVNEEEFYRVMKKREHPIDDIDSDDDDDF
mmetsp:Transcript_4138/g.6313  ORF Transcript_4138/g.6313 Transcript_4138/m.6313 type:complete len:189 (+) Transcript_4138:69-635(+)|eukprot:CAMPEP_0171455958 /NCGR_PEP_ID=MMETSP0945-20130129/2642_1 /TAXON_ID=109269 /ORGANISM="Vaucheria litorea, Strain CCMP2940" /LENGTH=188 /DNA_ID=CAMNT_0011981297 /DNA_START=63 /DNA_END=629 /DNA_ORIENTATION=-